MPAPVHKLSIGVHNLSNAVTTVHPCLQYIALQGLYSSKGTLVTQYNPLSTS